jgi:hypothetical protein
VEAWRVGGEDAEVPGEASRLVGVFAPAELEVADHDDVYGHLLPDAEEYLRGLLDNYDAPWRRIPMIGTTP